MRKPVDCFSDQVNTILPAWPERDISDGESKYIASADQPARMYTLICGFFVHIRT